MLFRGEQVQPKSGLLRVEHGTSSTSLPQRQFFGSCTTRDTVRAEADAIGTSPVGSVYFSDAGKIYLKVAANGATADWAKVTTSAAD